MRISQRLLMVLVFLLIVSAPLVAAQPVSAQCVQLIADGGFETGAGWTLGPNAAMPYYQTYAVHGGSRALALGIPAGGNLNSYSSARQTVTIPAGTEPALLSFWFYAMAEAPATTDYMEFVVLDPAGNILGKPWYSHNDSRVWNQMSLDLTAWRGQTVQLYFNVYNDGLGGKAAMFLDDVSLSLCGSGPILPTVTNTPLPGAMPTLTPAPINTLTPTSTPSTGCVQLVQNSSFTSLGSNWENEGNLAGVGIASSPEPVRTAPNSLRLGSTGAVINGLSTSRQMVAVPAGYSQVGLEAWVYPQSQINQGADYQELAILNSAGVVMSAPWRVVGTAGGWTRLAFDITSYAGQSIYIRFGVFNDGAGGQTVLYVDDVTVTACNPGPVPTVTPTWTPVVAPPTATASPTGMPPVATLPPTSGCIELVQNPSFEYGLYPWQTGQGNQLLAQPVGVPVYSGAWAAQMGSTTQIANTYSSLRQWVTVPGGYPQKIVSFYAYTWSESYAGADEQKFVVLGPGDVVLAVPWKTLSDAGAWQHFVFDLSSVTSNTFALYFAAINDGAGGRTALFIDDVHAYACTPGAVWPVPYVALGSESLPAAKSTLPDATTEEEAYPFADTPAIDPTTGETAVLDGEMTTGLTPVADPVLALQSTTGQTVEGGATLTPQPRWTEIALDDPPGLTQPETVGAAATPLPAAIAQAITPQAAPGAAVSAAAQTSKLTVWGKLKAAVNRTTAKWPPAGRVLVTILVILALAVLAFIIIRAIIRAISKGLKGKAS